MGSQSVPVGGFTLKAGDNSSITVTSITLQGQIDDVPSTTYANGMEAGPNSVASIMQDVKLWNGSTQLGQTKTPESSIGTGVGGALTFDGLSLVVSAGQTVTLTVTSNVVAGLISLPDRIRWTISTANDVVAVDAANVPVVTTAAAFPVSGNGYTIQNSGTISATLSPDDVESEMGIVVGGSSNAVLAKYRFTAQNEELKLTKVRLAVASTSSFAVSSLSLYDGATLVAGPMDINGSGIADFSSVNFVIPKDGTKNLTVKGNLNTVGSSGATTGLDVRVTLVHNANFEVHGTSAGSSTQITSLAGSIDGRSKIIRKSKPTISTVSLPSSSLSNTSLVAYRFTVSADAAGDVAMKKLSFESSLSLAGVGTTVAVDGIRRVGDGSNLLATATRDGNESGVDSCLGTDVICAIKVAFANEEVVAAGTSRAYDLRLTIGGTAVTSGDTISTKILGDSATVTGVITGTTPDVNVAGAAEENFVWSDISAVPHVDTLGSSSADWASGFLLKTLPSDTAALSKS